MGKANGTAAAAETEAAAGQGAAGISQELARQLAEQAKAEGLSLTGPGGLLNQVTKVVLESALEGEMDAHLGYVRHDPAGRDSGNSRNGRRPKTVVTDVGPVEVSVPRDRDASFEPVIVAKRQRRLSGVDDLVISLVAKGLTTGEVQARLTGAAGQPLRFAPHDFRRMLITDAFHARHAAAHRPARRRAPRHQHHHGIQGRLPRGSHQRAPRVHRPPPGTAAQHRIPHPDRRRMGRVPRPSSAASSPSATAAGPTEPAASTSTAASLN